VCLSGGRSHNLDRRAFLRVWSFSRCRLFVLIVLSGSTEADEDFPVEIFPGRAFGPGVHALVRPPSASSDLWCNTLLNDQDGLIAARHSKMFGSAAALRAPPRKPKDHALRGYRPRDQVPFEKVTDASAEARESRAARRSRASDPKTRDEMREMIKKLYRVFILFVSTKI
jgi:hypothetical protein